MTLEEQGVIMAAEAMIDGSNSWNPKETLRLAVAALRESRKPKPAWRVDGAAQIAGPDGRCVSLYGGGAGITLLRDRVLRLLNEDEQRGAR